jgi:uncharacterized membrane protein YphA (DoxX/SURF4 family)
MRDFYKIGRLFYGIAMAALGLLTICYRDVAYFLLPPNHSWLTDHIPLVYLWGTLHFIAGSCLILEKKLRLASLLLGAVLLLIFCFYFVPVQLSAWSTYKTPGAWENSIKELALAGGAFVMIGRKTGCIIFSCCILFFGAMHFIYAHEAADYISDWIPIHIFWMYLTGTALVGSSLAILFNIKRRLCALLLAIMIFIWVLMLHIPKSLAAPFAENAGEVTSGFLALAYCGTALVIARRQKNDHPLWK